MENNLILPERIITGINKISNYNDLFIINSFTTLFIILLFLILSIKIIYKKSKKEKKENIQSFFQYVTNYTN
jgi:hypothetical protein